MATRRITQRPGHELASIAAARADRGPMTVDIAEPFAVYWNGEQRTGTVEHMPQPVAMSWLNNGWAAYPGCPPSDDLAVAGVNARGGDGKP